MTFPLRDVGKFFGILIVCLGAFGWSSGYYFAQPIWLATGHPVMHSLGQLASILGPIFTICGILLYLFFAYGTLKGYEQPQAEPMRRLGGRRRVLIALLMVAMAIVGAYGVYLSIQQPQIALLGVQVTDAQGSFTNCWTPQIVGATFSITNSGPVGGYVGIRVSGGTYVIGEETYYVPAGSSITRSIQGSVPCNIVFKTVVTIVGIGGP